MLRIAVCEDVIHFQNKLRKWMEDILGKYKIYQYEVEVYASGRELLELGEKLHRYQAIFLDIDTERGIQTAQQLQMMEKDILLIFVTTHTALMQESYRLKAFRYVLKGNRNQLQEALETIIQLVCQQDVVKEYEFREGRREVRISQILYIESERHTMKFHLTNGKTYRITGKMEELEAELSSFSFIRIHKSYLVNYQHIKSISNYRVVLDEQQVLPIPREKYRHIRESYEELVKRGI